MKKVEELSASGIKKYKECPRRFQLHYLLDDLEPPEDGVVEHFQIGSSVHGALENVLRDLDKVPKKDELLDMLLEEESSLDYDYSDNDKVNNCLNTASRWITSFVTSIGHVEEKWTMERDGIEYNGLADLVADVEQDGMYSDVIVDWKTGQETEQWKERIQAGMYIEMFYEKFGHYPEAAVFVYLDEETQSFHSRIQDGEVFWNEHENQYWSEIQKYKNQILRSQRTEEKWETKPDQTNCYFCSYKYYCEDSPIGAENVTIQNIDMM